MTYVNSRSVLAVGIVFPILGLISVGLRFWIRFHRKTALGIDDWLCIPALILVTAHGGIMIAGVATHSVGYHSAIPKTVEETYIVNPPAQAMISKLETAFDIMHPITLATLKLCIVFFYRRLFPGQKFNIISWILICTIILWASVFIIAVASACGSHIEANWESLGALGKQCINTFGMLVSYTVTDVAVDLIILCIPVPLIWRLQLPTRRKIGICAALLVGALAISCGITRMVMFIFILAPGLSSVLANGKITGINIAVTDDIGIVSILMFWGMTEAGVGIVAVNLPTLRPLIRDISLESVVNSVRSALSLNSMASASRSGLGRSRPEGQKDPMSSESNFVNAEDLTYSGGTHEAYALGPVVGDSSKVESIEGVIRVEKKFGHELETV